MQEKLGQKPTSNPQHSLGEECSGIFKVSIQTTGKRLIWSFSIPIILWIAGFCIYFIFQLHPLSLAVRIALGCLGIILAALGCLGIKNALKRTGLYFHGIRFFRNTIQVGTLFSPSGSFKEIKEQNCLHLNQPQWKEKRSINKESAKIKFKLCSLKKMKGSYYIKEILLTSLRDKSYKITNNLQFSNNKLTLIRNNKVHQFFQLVGEGLNEKLLQQLEMVGVLFETYGLQKRGGCILKIESPWSTKAQASTAVFWNLWLNHGMSKNKEVFFSTNPVEACFINSSIDKKFFSLIQWFNWKVEIF